MRKAGGPGQATPGCPIPTRLQPLGGAQSPQIPPSWPHTAAEGLLMPPRAPISQHSHKSSPTTPVQEAPYLRAAGPPSALLCPYGPKSPQKALLAHHTPPD